MPDREEIGVLEPHVGRTGAAGGDDLVPRQYAGRRLGADADQHEPVEHAQVAQLLDAPSWDALWTRTAGSVSATIPVTSAAVYRALSGTTTNPASAHPR
jgi:hypothetical protein